MPDQRSPAELTADQLRDERDRLRHIAPQKATAADEERLRQLEAELGRRIDRGDPELEGPAIAGLEREAAQLPDLPKEADFTPAQLSLLPTCDLEALLRQTEVKLADWKAYDRTIPAAGEREKSHEQEKRTWLEKCTSEQAVRILEQGLRNIRHELTRRALKAGPSPDPVATPQPSEPPKPDESLRSDQKTKGRSPEAQPGSPTQAEAEPASRNAGNLDPKLELGKWIDKQLEAGALVAKLVRAGTSREAARNQFLQFFEEVIDVLGEHKRQQFFTEAKGKMMSQLNLVEYIGEVKGLKGSYALKLRTQYRQTL